MDLVESLPQAPQGRNSTKMKRTATDQFSLILSQVGTYQKNLQYLKASRLKTFLLILQIISDLFRSIHPLFPSPPVTTSPIPRPEGLKSEMPSRRYCVGFVGCLIHGNLHVKLIHLDQFFFEFVLNILVTRGKWILMVKICSNKSWCIIRWEKKWNRDGKTLHKHLCFHFVCHRVHHMISTSIYIYYKCIYIYIYNYMDMTCVVDISSWIAGDHWTGPLHLWREQAWPVDCHCVCPTTKIGPQNGGLSFLLHVFNPWSFW